MKWIRVEDELPEDGQLVVAWMHNKQEPSCCRYEKDKGIWRELIAVDIWDPREDLISHWMPLPEPPEKNES